MGIVVVLTAPALSYGIKQSIRAFSTVILAVLSVFLLVLN